MNRSDRITALVLYALASVLPIVGLFGAVQVEFRIVCAGLVCAIAALAFEAVDE